MKNNHLLSTDAPSNLNDVDSVIWDLSDLYPSHIEGNFVADLEQLDGRAEKFAKEWRGRVATLSEQELVRFIAGFADMYETADRLGSYTHLLWSTDTLNPETGKLLQRVREEITRAFSRLAFVSVELCTIPAERITELAQTPDLAAYKHWIETVNVRRPHTLSEEVEQVLSEKSLTSRSAWIRLHDEVQNRQVYPYDGEMLTEPQILKKLHSPNREERKAASEVFSTGLNAIVGTQAYIFNTVLADHAQEDRLRKHTTWIESRNQSNEANSETVDKLIESVVSRYELLHRAYALKQRLLAVETFYDYDRYAPVGNAASTVWSWEQARTLVVESYTAFHPRAGEIAAMFFDNNWIHAPVLKGKSGGAYSAGTVASVHPYVFMNYTGTSRDVQVLAHELGHGIHQFLSRGAGQLLMDTPLTVAETASVFGEMLVFRTLLERTTTREERLALLVAKIDDTMSTVMRQIALNRFEDAVHTARRAEGELSVERFSELWMETQRPCLGPNVVLSSGYKNWWCYISHFIHTPGYVYAYAFGELLVLALYERYRSAPEGFPELYIEMLSAGGSKSPEDLLAPLGMDISDPAFWQKGLASIDALISEAEALAAEIAG